jgi:hypothetical protein
MKILEMLFRKRMFRLQNVVLISPYPAGQEIISQWYGE